MRAIAIALRWSTGEEVRREAVGVVAAPVVAGVVGIFIALPGMLTAGLPDLAADVTEAASRAAMLLVYLAALSRSATSQRLFGYHGAEHMAIAAFERLGRMPSAAEARAESPVHVRCGTDFLALIVIASGFVYSSVGRQPLWAGALMRVALLPVVAALAYEVMRWCAASPDRLWSRLLTWPGRSLQRVTTRAPDDGQLEVALAALRAAADEPA